MVEPKTTTSTKKSRSGNRSSQSRRKPSQLKSGVAAAGSLAAVGTLAYVTRHQWLPLLKHLVEQSKRLAAADLARIWSSNRSAKKTDYPVTHPNQSAMQDKDINRRLEEYPADADARLDAGLDQSMDASDPPAIVQPGDNGEPMPSSGFDAKYEARLQRQN